MQCPAAALLAAWHAPYTASTHTARASVMRVGDEATDDGGSCRVAVGAQTAGGSSALQQQQQQQRGRCCCTVARYAPLPVTIRQVWLHYNACCDSDNNSNSNNNCSGSACLPDGDASGTRRRRPGDATLCVDGVWCSHVVLCGRVVACTRHTQARTHTPYSRHAHNRHAVCASTLPRRPVTLLVVSDMTGMVGVMHYHAEQDSDSDDDADDDDTSISGSDDEGAAAAATVMAAHGSVPPQRSRADDADTDATTAAAAGDGRGLHTRDAVTFVPLDVQVNDYVVCVGRLCFADVDDDVHAHFAHVHCPSLQTARNKADNNSSSKGDASTRAQLCSTAATAGAAALPSPSSWRKRHHDDDNDDKTAMLATHAHCTPTRATTAVTTCMATSSPSPAAADADADVASDDDTEQAMVLLPGSDVPVRVSALAAMLGVVGELPAAHAQQWLCPRDAHTVRTRTHDRRRPRCRGDGSDDDDDDKKQKAVKEDAASAADVHTPHATSADDMCMPFCVKGTVRRVAAASELLYWQLSALHTHLRRRRHCATAAVQSS